MSTGGTNPAVRRLLLCYGIAETSIPEYPMYPIGLAGMIQRPARPPDRPFAFVYDGLWLYFEAMGQPGRYELNFDVVCLDADGQAIGPPSIYSYPLLLVEAVWFEGRYGRLRVPISRPGVHEVRIRYGDTVLARDQFLVMEG